MEIKATLNKPYTDRERADFIVANNHTLGYEIKETETALEAWGLTEEEQKQADLENKQKSVRAVREQYFIEYVDWYQSKPLLWDEMTEEEKQDIADYRHYLMDYTKQEDWWEQNPLNFEEWKNDQSSD
jgi:acetyl-CoA acetyltransferase